MPTVLALGDETALSALKAGAHSLMHKPFEISRVLHLLSGGPR